MFLCCKNLHVHIRVENKAWENVWGLIKQLNVFIFYCCYYCFIAVVGRINLKIKSNIMEIAKYDSVKTKLLDKSMHLSLVNNTLSLFQPILLKKIIKSNSINVFFFLVELKSMF